jgi:hypothetical protein
MATKKPPNETYIDKTYGGFFPEKCFNRLRPPYGSLSERLQTPPIPRAYPLLISITVFNSDGDPLTYTSPYTDKLADSLAYYRTHPDSNILSYTIAYSDGHTITLSHTDSDAYTHPHP